MTYGYSPRPADSDEARGFCEARGCENKVRRVVRYLTDRTEVACLCLCGGHAPKADRMYVLGGAA